MLKNRNKDFHELLKEKIKRSSLRDVDICDELDISPRTLSSWKKGDTEPKLSQAEHILNLLDESVKNSHNEEQTRERSDSKESDPQNNTKELIELFRKVEKYRDDLDRVYPRYRDLKKISRCMYKLLSDCEIWDEYCEKVQKLEFEEVNDDFLKSLLEK